MYSHTLISHIYTHRKNAGMTASKSAEAVVGHVFRKGGIRWKFDAVSSLEGKTR